MSLFQPGMPDYEARIGRARYLAGKYPFAAEILKFYEVLAAFQKSAHSTLARDSRLRPTSFAAGRMRKDAAPDVALGIFTELLRLMEIHGPAPVKAAARNLAEKSADRLQTLLLDFWRSGNLPKEDSTSLGGQEALLVELMLRTFLQPHAEVLAAQAAEVAAEPSRRTCPLCDSSPLLGVLRPEGDGAKRFLQCSFCLHEWEFRRIFCAACGEDVEGKLPVYVAAQFPHIRVECCDTCKFFVRTIDLTKDGHAVPVVDDLSAIPLSLWADEHGYTRLQPNLLGT